MTAEDGFFAADLMAFSHAPNANAESKSLSALELGMDADSSPDELQPHTATTNAITIARATDSMTHSPPLSRW